MDLEGPLTHPIEIGSRLILAHGVGRVYESPIPLWLYLAGAATTIFISFVLRILAREERQIAPERRILGGRAARGIVLVLRAVALVGLFLTIVSGAVVGDRGATFATYSLWVGLVVGMTLLNAVIAGAWTAADPWATVERFYRIDDAEPRRRLLPWWVGPLLLFGLFWFELVSGVGFESFWVVAVLVGYSLFVFAGRASLAGTWAETDPLSILFGFAGRSAPLRLDEKGMWARSPLTGLDEERPMPLALYASVFVLLASTTFDNLSETVGWNEFVQSIGADALPGILTDTLALALLAIPFLVTFLGVVWAARRWLQHDAGLHHTARLFGWSLVPIGIAYVLAHNAPLLITGLPQLLRFLSDPFEQGWNVLGTADLWSGFVASPALVWFLEILLIVGGHILAVLVAHRIAVRLAPSPRDAAMSQYALTLLMSLYTIATLWLLSQPLVTHG